MVRINLINPSKLTDQHLIAEYNEILMLIGHIKKFPNIYSQPKTYTLGKGHINFFKNKIKYLK
ncbi:MAG: pyrimidine dimer DNA glycosylase/endonuclease V, partial [Nanoarchaeota archaeon]|nr:pyrimidine dimer DNA glycosylase/endonuclease V [Nanoarchaeota archaeon]